MRSALRTAIQLYRNYLSPLLGPRCRFYPSCSEYAIGCLDRYPLLPAALKIILRLFKCQPWHPGGVDLP